jgi:1,4-dihydroxy-2-naphthoate octaprenyltransferase
MPSEANKLGGGRDSHSPNLSVVLFSLGAKSLTASVPSGILTANIFNINHLIREPPLP